MNLKLDKFLSGKKIQTENIPLTRQTDFVTPLHDNSLTRSMEISKNGHEADKPYSIVNPEPEPPSLDSLSKTFLSDSRSRKKKRDKKKKRRKHQKYDSSDPCLSDDHDSSDDSDYRHKRHKKKRHKKRIRSNYAQV